MKWILRCKQLTFCRPFSFHFNNRLAFLLNVNLIDSDHDDIVCADFKIRPQTKCFYVRHDLVKRTCHVSISAINQFYQIELVRFSPRSDLTLSGITWVRVMTMTRRKSNLMEKEEMPTDASIVVLRAMCERCV